MLLVSCRVPGVVFTAHQSPAERTNSTTVISSAVRRASATGPNSTGIAPTSGSTSRTWRIQRSNPTEARNCAIGGYRTTARRSHTAPIRKTTM